MTLRREIKRNKMNKKRCCYSNKILGSKRALLEEFAVEYVKKMGYLVSRFRFLFMALFVGLALPDFVSAELPLVLQMDFSERANIVITFMFFVFAGILAFLRLFVFSGFLVFILGLLMLFNGINIVLSYILIGLGVALSFK